MSNSKASKKSFNLKLKKSNSNLSIQNNEENQEFKPKSVANLFNDQESEAHLLNPPSHHKQQQQQQSLHQRNEKKDKKYKIFSKSNSKAALTFGSQALKETNQVGSQSDKTILAKNYSGIYSSSSVLPYALLIVTSLNPNAIQSIDLTKSPSQTEQNESKSNFTLDDLSVSFGNNRESHINNASKDRTNQYTPIADKDPGESNVFNHQNTESADNKLIDTAEKNSVSMSFQQGQLVIAVAGHTPQDLHEMDLIPGDLVQVLETVSENDFWLKGVLLTEGNRFGQKGFIPISCVCLPYTPSMTNPIQEKVKENNLNQSATDSTTEIPPVPPGTQAIAKYHYDKKKNDEISFQAGNKIIILKCFPGGWWKGINADESGSKVSGWFPVNLVDFDLNTLESINQNNSIYNTENSSSEEKQQSPSNFSHFKKRLLVSGSSEANRSVSSPTLIIGDISPHSFNLQNNSADNPILNPALLKSKSLLEESSHHHHDALLKPDQHRRKSSALEIHFNELPHIMDAKIDSIQDVLGDEVVRSFHEKEKKRLYCVLELIQTERDYVRDLVIIIQVFLKPMTNQTTIGSKNISLLFSNIEQIASVNYKFLLLMMDLKITNVSDFGELFLNHMEKFMCYIPYCSNQNSNWEKVTKPILNKSDIKQFLRDTHKNPLLRLLNIQGFLIKPVQRICKYPLFLKEMIKHTTPGHQDLIILHRALEKVELCLSVINESAKLLNGFKPLQEIQLRFVEKISIHNNSRFIIREDNVTALYKNSNVKSRKLLFFNDLLIISKTHTWNSKLILLEKISLKEIRIHDIQDDSNVAVLEMEILPQYESDSMKRYIFSFASAADKKGWIEAYKSLVRTIIKVKHISDLLLTESNFEDDGESEMIPGSTDQDVRELYTRLDRLESGISLRNDQIKSIHEEKEAAQNRCVQLEAQLEELNTRLKSQDNDRIKIKENEIVISDQSKKILAQEEEIKSLRESLQKTTLEFQNKIDSQEKDLSNTKELLLKTKESLLARAESKENLQKKMHEKITTLNAVVSKEEDLKTQILELQVQIASLELNNSHAQNQVENEKKDLMVLLDAKQDELLQSEKKVRELEESFLEETDILQKEYDHVQFELSEEKIQNRDMKERLLFTIKNLENQLNETKKNADFILQDNQVIKTTNIELETRLQSATLGFEKEKKEMQDKYNETRGEVDQLKVSMKEIIDSLENANGNVSKLADRARNLENEKDSLQQESMLLKTQVQYLTDKCGSIEMENQSIIMKYEVDLKEILSEKERLNNIYQSEIRKNESLESIISLLKAELETKDAERDIKDQKYSKDVDEMKAFVQRLESEKVGLSDTLAIKDKELQNIESEYQYLQISHSDLLKEMKNFQLEMDSQKTSFNNQFEMIQKDKNSLLEKAKSEHESKIQEKLNEITLLKEIIENLKSNNLSHHNQLLEALKSENESLFGKNSILATDIESLKEEIERLKNEHEESLVLFQKSASANLLKQSKSFDKRLEEQIAICHHFENEQNKLKERIDKLNDESNRKTNNLVSFKKFYEEEKSMLTNQNDQLNEEIRILKENHMNEISIRQMEISDMKNRYQVLFNEKTNEFHELTSKIEGLNHIISSKDHELVQYRFRLDSQQKEFQKSQNEYQNDINQAKLDQLEKEKNIHDFLEQLQVAEQVKLQLESSISTQNAKLIDAESKMTLLKEAHELALTSALEELKKKTEIHSIQLQSKDEIILSLEEMKLSLKASLDIANDKIISQNINVQTLQSQNDRLLAESNTHKLQLEQLHSENENFNLKILQLQNLLKDAKKEFEAIEHQLLKEKNLLVTQQVGLEKDFLTQLQQKDNTIKCLDDKIKLLEKTLEDDIAKLTALQQNPAPNPKELLNSHILRKKLEDQYNIALNTINHLKSSLVTTEHIAEKEIKKVKEDCRMKIEISSRAINNLEEKNYQLSKAVKSLNEENSVTLSKLKETKHQFEVSQNNLKEQSNIIKSLISEKEEILAKLTTQKIEAKHGFDSEIYALKSENIKIIETLNSTINSLTLERHNLILEIEALKNSHNTFLNAHENEKRNLSQQVHLLNDSLTSKSSVILHLEKELHLLKVDSSEVVEKLKTEFKVNSQVYATTVSQISVLNIEIQDLKAQIKSKDSLINLLRQNEFVSTTILNSKRLTIECGLRNQVEVVTSALKATKKRESRLKDDYEKRISALLERCKSLENEIVVNNEFAQKAFCEFEAQIQNIKSVAEVKTKELNNLQQEKTIQRELFERDQELKDQYSLSKDFSMLEAAIKHSDQEKWDLLNENKNLESLSNRDVENSQIQFNNNKILRNEILKLQKMISDLELDKIAQISKYERLLESKNDFINNLEQKFNALQISDGSSTENEFTNTKKMTESERSVLLSEITALKREKQILEIEKAKLEKRLGVILDSNEETALDLTIKMKDIQHHLKKEIDVLHKQILEKNELYRKEKDQHMETGKQLQETLNTKLNLEAKFEELKAFQKELLNELEKAKKESNLLRHKAASDIQVQEANNKHELMAKTTKIEELQSKILTQKHQITLLKNKLDSHQTAFEDKLIDQFQKNNLLGNHSQGVHTEIENLKRKVKQLEAEKEQISLTAAKSHSNEIHLLDMISDKSTELRKVLNRLNELEVANELLLKSSSMKNIKVQEDQMKSDEAMLKRQIKIQHEILRKVDAEMKSFKNVFAEISQKLKLSITWKSIPIAQMLQNPFEWSKLTNIDDYSNIKTLLQILDSIQKLLNEKDRFSSIYERQRVLLQEAAKDQRLTNLKLDQSHEIIHQLQQKLEHIKSPYKFDTFQKTKTAAQYEILEVLFKKTAADLSQCQSQLSELKAEKTQLEQEFKELFEKLTNIESKYQERLHFAESNVDSFKAEVARLNRTVDELRKQTSKIHEQKCRSDDLLKKSISSAHFLMTKLK